MSDLRPRDVLDFWFKDTPSQKWFSPDPAFDALITAECAFDELPDALPRLASGDLPGLCLRVRYDR